MGYTDVTETKRIEAALRQSEQRYALALSGANDGISEWRDEVDGVYASQRLRETVGLQIQQASHPTDPWLARIHPDDRNEIRWGMRSPLERKYDAADPHKPTQT